MSVIGRWGCPIDRNHSIPALAGEGFESDVTWGQKKGTIGVRLCNFVELPAG
jgi:hypothetical protein